MLHNFKGVLQNILIRRRQRKYLEQLSPELRAIVLAARKVRDFSGMLDGQRLPVSGVAWTEVSFGALTDDSGKGA